MTQSVELLLDEAAESRVLAEWRHLLDAGLASQARHTGASNRPHVTLVAGSELDQGAEAAVEHAVSGLPVASRLGGLAVFGRDPVVLVRMVVVTPALLALHRAVAVATGTGHEKNTAVGRWVPHVTLAHRMPLAQLATALKVLSSDDVLVTFERVRRWDSVARRAWLVG
jgi:2'-5' RNA ligase